MAPERFIVGGVPIDIISDEQAELVDYVVCAPWGPSPFDDNMKGVCSRCGCTVMYRWHAPKRPPKICIDCASKAAEEMPGKQVTTRKKHS